MALILLSLVTCLLVTCFLPLWPLWPLSGGHCGVILEAQWPWGFLFGTKIGAKSYLNRIKLRCGPYGALLTLVFASDLFTNFCDAVVDAVYDPTNEANPTLIVPNVAHHGDHEDESDDSFIVDG